MGRRSKRNDCIFKVYIKHSWKACVAWGGLIWWRCQIVSQSDVERTGLVALELTHNSIVDFRPIIISDPAVILSYSRTEIKKLKREGVALCFVFHCKDIPKETHFHELMKLSK